MSRPRFTAAFRTRSSSGPRGRIPSVLKTRFALLLIFFLSGISALIYQVVWLKYLGLIFGNTVYAAATLIAVYLAGLGIGGALFGRRARNWDPLVV